MRASANASLQRSTLINDPHQTTGTTMASRRERLPGSLICITSRSHQWRRRLTAVEERAPPLSPPQDTTKPRSPPTLQHRENDLGRPKKAKGAMVSAIHPPEICMTRESRCPRSTVLCADRPSPRLFSKPVRVIYPPSQRVPRFRPVWAQVRGSGRGPLSARPSMARSSRRRGTTVLSGTTNAKFGGKRRRSWCVVRSPRICASPCPCTLPVSRSKHWLKRPSLQCTASSRGRPLRKGRRRNLTGRPGFKALPTFLRPNPTPRLPLHVAMRG